MRLWHLLVRQVYKSDNPENLIILKILVQTTARGQSTQSTPNTRVVFVPTLWAGNLSAPDLLSELKTPPTSIYGTKLTPMVRLGNRTYRLGNRIIPLIWYYYSTTSSQSNASESHSNCCNGPNFRLTVKLLGVGELSNRLKSRTTT